MNPALNVMFGGLALFVSVATLAVYSALIASSRGDEQAAKMRVPVRRNRRYSRSVRYDKN